MNNKTIYALGYFDGVHCGHQALLAACAALSNSQNCQSGAVTFIGHPQQLISGKPVSLISTPPDRRKLLSGNVDTVVELAFTESLMAMPWQDFLNMLTIEYGAAGFVCGSDFRFGRKGDGTARLLQEYCQTKDLVCSVIPQQYLDGIRISSTHIRSLLENGNLTDACRFLGHPHTLTGIVQRGKQLGRTIGFPTANLPYPEELVKLPYGVYACRATVDGRAFDAITNIGTRPTVAGENVTVETHLLNFSGDLYGKEITLEFLEFIRPEQKFESLAALQKQIAKDAEYFQSF